MRQSGISLGSADPNGATSGSTWVDRLCPNELSQALRDAGELEPGRTVTSVVPQPLGVGKAMMSSLMRLHLTYDAPSSGPPSLVVKQACDDPFRRSVADRFSFYERERYFYERLAGSVPFRVPGCYLAAVDPATAAPVLLLEDLGDLSTAQAVGCSWEVALVAARELARFHSQWWGTADTLAADVHAYNSPDYVRTLGALFSESWQHCRRHAADRTPEVLADLGDRWESDVLPAVAEILSRPATLCHGDFRSDNLRLVDEALVVFDFQLLVRGNGISDLAYFTTQSLPTEVRTGRDGELLDLYLAALRTQGVNYDRSEAWEAYRATALYMLVFPVVLYQAYHEQPPNGRDLIDAMFGRSVAAITELEAWSVLGQR